MTKTSADLDEATLRNLQKNTGKTVQQWMDLILQSAPKEQKDHLEWLKKKHGLGSGEAMIITKMINYGVADYDPIKLMKSHFNGEKDYQKPIFDKIAAVLKNWGPHKIAVNKTSLSLIHNHQFAILKTTKSGMIIGVPGAAVKSAKNKDFISTKNLGSDRITHKLIVNDVSELLNNVLQVLKASYDMS
jgi:hypothetical protein